MYKLSQFFTQKPEDIKALVLLILTALVLRDVITADGEEVALWGLIIEQLLSRFYVAPVKEANTEKALVAVGEAIEEAKRQAPRRQLRVEDNEE